MITQLAILQKAPLPRPKLFQRVDTIARHLLSFMNREEIQAEIAGRHMLGADSAGIQAVIAEKARELGFQSEKKGLFATYPTSQLRPDYYLPLDGSGVIMEVERGKTTTNNMDFLDLWKCHICKDAHFLFLVVPQVRESANGSKLYHYRQVQNRLASFFEPDNYVNVDAVFVFGY